MSSPEPQQDHEEQDIGRHDGQSDLLAIHDLLKGLAESVGIGQQSVKAHLELMLMLAAWTSTALGTREAIAGADHLTLDA
jgi:hypothetical protein